MRTPERCGPIFEAMSIIANTRMSRDRRTLVVPVLVLAAVAGGCASAISSFTPAHVGPKGQWSAQAGIDVAVPTGSIGSLVDAGKALAEAARTRQLGEDEKIRLFAAGVNLALNTPAFVQHIAVTYNPADRWQGSLGYAGGAWRLAGRHQWLAQEDDGADLSVGIGVSRYARNFPLADIIDLIDIDGYRRWTLDLPIAIGRHGRYHRLWTGPKVAFIHQSAKLVLHSPQRGDVAAHDDEAGMSGNASLWGGHAGAALGYKSVFLGAELTIARLIGTAELNVFGRTTRADTSSWVISPGLALMGEF
jgi:hypothetical protein